MEKSMSKKHKTPCCSGVFPSLREFTQEAGNEEAEEITGQTKQEGGCR
jgi:hypothetical protein